MNREKRVWGEKSGFTLVELLIVMTILVVLAIILVGIINPNALMGKANDSKRKSDLNKIRTAFEEFFSDKGRYPTINEINTWNRMSNCDKSIPDLKHYLRTWPCDPDKKLYQIVVDPSWFKVVTNLKNKQDKDIPTGWYNPGTYSDSGFDKSSVNYGVSSLNILWYGNSLSSFCDSGICYIGSECNIASSVTGCNTNRDGKECYLRDTVLNSCNSSARIVPCCGAGCN